MYRIAVGGLIAAAIGLSAYSKDAAKPVGQKPTQSASAPAKPAALPTPPQYRAPYKPRCEAPRDRDEASFCQERQAAQIALEANEIARRNIWLSLAGLVALIVTLYYTAKAAKAADVAAKAAQASVQHSQADAVEQSERFAAQLEVARDAAYAAAESAGAAVALVDTSRLNNIGDLRAYVTLEEINIKLMWDHPGANGKLVGYVFDCVWRNGGKSPAVNVVAAVNEMHGYGGRLSLNDYGFPDFEGYDPTKLNIGPHGHITMPVRIDADRMHQRPDAFTFIYGWIEYDDIVGSGERHRTEFCHEVLRAPRLSENPIVLLKTGPFNGIDKTCHHKPKS